MVVAVTGVVVASNQDPMIVFAPSGKRGRFPHGTTVLEAARRLGVDLDSVCGGRGICERCEVEIAEERRLGCQTRIETDVVIDVPASSQVHQQVVRKPHEHHDITIDPVVHPYFVEVPVPLLDEALGDLERLRNVLASEWQLRDLTCEPAVVRDLQGVLAKDKRQLTVAVRNSNRIIAVWPGFRNRLYGVAFDVGSTTVAAHLCDLASGEVIASAGRMNPQIQLREDAKRTLTAQEKLSQLRSCRAAWRDR